MTHSKLAQILLTVVAMAIATTALAQSPPPHDEVGDALKKQDNYSPYAGRNFPTHVLFGDTHVHTGMSMDAGAFGARLQPEDAHRHG